MTTDRHYDVAIVGGGCTGAALAAALGRAGLAVAVIERRDYPRDWPAEPPDTRVFAITPAVQGWLEAIGVWAGIAPAACAYQRMLVWDAGSGGEIAFDAAELARPALGHIVEERVLHHALGRAAEGQAGVDWICPGELEALELGTHEAVLRLAEGRSLRAQLVVGADGKRSPVRRLAGLPVRLASYDQHAVVGPVRTRQGHADTAWQRFLPTGPLAFLPLADGRCSIVWSTSPDEAARLAGLPGEAFAAELAEASQRRLGEIDWVGPRVAYPLERLHAPRYVAGRLALIGDAAHVIHPLAGQGVNLGLYDAACLARVITETRARGRDFGRLEHLRRYERARKGENQMMQSAMDALRWLFGPQPAPLRGLRGLGLDLVDAAAPLKRLFARQAMGRLVPEPDDGTEFGPERGSGYS